MFIRSIITFVKNFKTARPEKKKPYVYPLFVHFFFAFTLRQFLINHRDTGTPKLLDELPKIATIVDNREENTSESVRRVNVR